MLWDYNFETEKYEPTWESDPMIVEVLAKAKAICGIPETTGPIDPNKMIAETAKKMAAKEKKKAWIPPPGWRPKKKKPGRLF